MSSLDRFVNRQYYETKFAEDETVLWLWETGQSTPSVVFAWHKYVQRAFSYRDYTNNLFIPADLFTTESTPDYFLIDIYGISSGGFGSYRSDRYTHHFEHHYRDHYFSGGSGACIYMANAKIRLRDEDLKDIKYTMSGKPGPTDLRMYSGSQVSPYRDNKNLNDWKLSLAEPFRTPDGIAPAGTIIMAMGSGGNAQMGAYAIGNGAGQIYVPKRAGFPVSADTLKAYKVGEAFQEGEWFNYNETAYKALSDFTATTWETDKAFSEIAPTYDSNTQYTGGTYLYWNNQLYRIDISFKGDEGNSLLGFADYFLNKDSVTTDIRNLGRDGTHVINGGHFARGGECNRVFKESSITPGNEVWLRKSLSWGNGQNSTRPYGNGGQGGGLVIIYHGETN